jgi:predicted aldo/keto reductase-like oxidoreductase
MERGFRASREYIGRSGAKAYRGVERAPFIQLQADRPILGRPATWPASRVDTKEKGSMSLRPRTIAISALALSLALGFFVSGTYLYRAFIGLEPSGFPAGDVFQVIGRALLPELEFTVAGVVLAFGMILLFSGVVFFVMRSSVRAASAGDPARRSFLTGTLSGAGVALGSAVLGGGAAFARALGLGNEGRGWGPVGGEIFGGDVVKTHPEWKQEWRESRVQGYGRLGRTGWKVSDIVVGTGPLDGAKGEKIVRLAIERGVNYVDTSPDYSATGSENAVGAAIRGVRDQIFLATKFCSPGGHLPAGTPVTRYKQAVEGSLQRLGTDHVDLVHVHSCDELDRLLDENMFEAFDRLKEEGKVRFLGFSSHTPNLVQVANAAIDSGRFDVMMLAYHHGIWSGLDPVIERARREQDMGVVAMKTLKGAKHHGLEGFREEADSYAQAALKWVHANPNVSCAVISFFELQHVDEYLHASGKQPTQRDLATLRKYDQQILGSYCAPHCGACLDSCPEGLPIHDVLRHRMYFEDYGWEKEAMRLYSKLETNAAVCAGCSAPCLGSCPVGIPIPERTREAHELLTLA